MSFISFFQIFSIVKCICLKKNLKNTHTHTHIRTYINLYDAANINWVKYILFSLLFRWLKYIYIYAYISK